MVFKVEDFFLPHHHFHTITKRLRSVIKTHFGIIISCYDLCTGKCVTPFPVWHTCARVARNVHRKFRGISRKTYSCVNKTGSNFRQQKTGRYPLYCKVVKRFRHFRFFFRSEEVGSLEKFQYLLTIVYIKKRAAPPPVSEKDKQLIIQLQAPSQTPAPFPPCS